MHRLLLGFLLATLAILSSGCASLAYYEKGRLLGDAMAFEADPTEANIYQKTYYSREGSTGGIGSVAGGGCGCY